MRDANIILASAHVNLDFYTISTATWRAIEIASLLGGAAIGFILQLLFKNAGFGLSSSRLQTFSGGCLLPVLISLLTAIGIDQVVPDCRKCGFTPDATFVPLVVFPLMTFFRPLGVLRLRLAQMIRLPALTTP